MGSVDVLRFFPAILTPSCPLILLLNTPPHWPLVLPLHEVSLMKAWEHGGRGEGKTSKGRQVLAALKSCDRRKFEREGEEECKKQQYRVKSVACAGVEISLYVCCVSGRDGGDNEFMFMGGVARVKQQ